VAIDADRARTDRTTSTLAGIVRGRGILFLAAAAAFFLGSGVLTRSGEPGASTPVPWLASHAIWVVATAFVALGALRLVSAVPSLQRGIAGYAASGLFGLGVLHALQWTAWVYVDVFAYRQGSHDLLSAPLLHPFGTAHMLVFAVLVGSGVATFARALAPTDVTGRAIPWLGLGIGALTVLSATVAILTVADVRTPASLAAILLQAVSFAWLGLVGIVLIRDRPVPGPERSTRE
jgi:hypothetical protein